MKKLLSIILTLGLILSLFTACGSETAASVSVSESAAVSEAAAPVSEAVSNVTDDADAVEASVVPEEAEVVEAEPESTSIAAINGKLYTAELPLSDEDAGLSIWAKYESMIPEYDTYSTTVIIQKLEEMTGVSLEFTESNRDTERDLFNLMVSSGLWCDITMDFVTLYSSGADAAIDGDIILDLNDYMDYAPNYASIIAGNNDIRTAVTTDSGSIGAFYAINADDTYTTSGLMIRKDWLDELGYEIPVTFDELTDFLQACMDAYGCDKSIIINSEGVMTNLIATFGIAASMPESGRAGAMYYMDQNQIKYGPTSAEFKDYLTIMHDWYEKGILFGDYFTNGEGLPSMEKSVPANRTAVFTAGGGTSVDTFVDLGTDANPDFNIIAMADPVVEGSTVDYIQTTSAVGNGIFSVMASCENVELAMKWCDFWYTEEGFLLSRFGIEGESYEMVDESPVFTDLIKNNPNYSERQITSIYTWNVNSKSAPTDFSSKSENEINAINTWTADTKTRLATLENRYVNTSVLSMSADESETYSSLMSDIATYISENITRFITGDRDLAEYNDYVTTIEEMGIAQCVDIMQTAYDRYLTR